MPVGVCVFAASACVCVCGRAPTERLIKGAIIGDNWTEVLQYMSSRSTSHPRNPSPPLLPSPVPPNQPPSSTIQAPAPHGRRLPSTARGPSLGITALQAAQYACQKISITLKSTHSQTLVVMKRQTRFLLSPDKPHSK